MNRVRSWLRDSRYKWIIVTGAGVAVVAVVAVVALLALSFVARNSDEPVVADTDDRLVVADGSSRILWLDFYSGPLDEEPAHGGVRRCAVHAAEKHLKVYVEELCYENDYLDSYKLIVIEDPSVAKESKDEWANDALGPQGSHLRELGFKKISHKQGHWDIGSESEHPCFFDIMVIGGWSLEVKALPPFRFVAGGKRDALKWGSPRAWQRSFNAESLVERDHLNRVTPVHFE